MGNAPRLQAAICRIGDKGVLSHDDVPILPFARRPRMCIVHSPMGQKVRRKTDDDVKHGS